MAELDASPPVLFGFFSSLAGVCKQEEYSLVLLVLEPAGKNLYQLFSTSIKCVSLHPQLCYPCQSMCFPTILIGWKTVQCQVLGGGCKVPI
jgi:hypothetical protein